MLFTFPFTAIVLITRLMVVLCLRFSQIDIYVYIFVCRSETFTFYRIRDRKVSEIAIGHFRFHAGMVACMLSSNWRCLISSRELYIRVYELKCGEFFVKKFNIFAFMMFCCIYLSLISFSFSISSPSTCM